MAAGTCSGADRRCVGRELVLPDPDAVSLGMANSLIGWFSEMVICCLGSTRAVKVDVAATNVVGLETRELGYFLTGFFVFLVAGLCQGGEWKASATGMAKTMHFPRGGGLEEDDRAFDCLFFVKDGRYRFGQWVWWSPTCDEGFDGG